MAKYPVKPFIASLILSAFFAGGYFASNLIPIDSDPDLIEPVAAATEKEKKQVLGSQDRPPQIFVYGGDYRAGGLIALASTDEPVIHIGGYELSGTTEVELYRANEAAMLDFLTHDKDGKQTKLSPDTGQFEYVTKITENINYGDGYSKRVMLPLEATGIWYTKITIGSNKLDAFILRSSVGVLVQEGDNQLIFWGQDFSTKRSISYGNIKLLNLQDSPRELQRASFSSDGVATATTDAEIDIALVEYGEERAVVPINLRHLNYDYSYQSFGPKIKLARYFIFTDRPIYQPGDTVYFKAILRNDDDARYTIERGQAIAKIFNSYLSYEGSGREPVFERSYPISADGTINGEYQIPANSKTGYHSLSIALPNQEYVNYWNGEWSSSSIGFEVEHFRKPEYSIDIETPKTEFIAGDKASFKISGDYFSGQPLANQKVKYQVYTADFYEYHYAADRQREAYQLNHDYRYANWYSGERITEGEATLNEQGEAEIQIETKGEFSKGSSQVFSIEATLEDGSQNPAFARRNLLIYAGDYGIFREDYSYGTKVNTPFSLPLLLIPYYNNTPVSGINLTAKVHQENWVSYQEEGKKYPSYRKEEMELPDIKATSNNQGKAVFNFTPKKTGSYTLKVSGKDARGNLIAKEFYVYVSAENEPHYTSGRVPGLTIAADKQKYEPTDTVRLTINSLIPDRDVFLSLERGRVNRYQIVSINGNSASIDLPLVNTDVPNIYAKVAGFSDYQLESEVINLPVSAEGKRLSVKLTPDSKTYGPGETVTVNVSTTDQAGNPVAAELALWAVDKAIFELSDNKLGDIFSTFWFERWNNTQQAHSLEGILVNLSEGGGCFGEGTTVLMADGSLKKIEEIVEGEEVLTRTDKDQTPVKAKVTGTHKTTEYGYLIINGHLKVTADHILWVNNSWREAGSIMPGDDLTGQDGQVVRVESVEWQRGELQVYNLTVEKYHSYFAGGVYVHNDKGMDRTVFKDTAYWNPSFKTDRNGQAKVSFKLPDNLTTWTIAAVAATADTRVGQAAEEIVVSKEIIVRPIIPNLLRVGDEAVLSALVQNYTAVDQTLKLNLDFDAGGVEEAEKPDMTLKPNETRQVYWKVKPEEERDPAGLVFGAKSSTQEDLGDVITQEIPVLAFGFAQKRAESGEGDKKYRLELAPIIDLNKTRVTLALSPTLLGTLPKAIEYLVGYPYGCVEQTTSSFGPALLVKSNPNLLGESLLDRDLDAVIERGISRLNRLQQPDGGFTWWYTGDSDPFISAYAAEYLVKAKEQGYTVETHMLDRLRAYFEQEKYYNSRLKQQSEYTREQWVAKNYGLTLLGNKDKVRKVDDLGSLTPDLVALSVMTNYLNGDRNPDTNGLKLLTAMAQTQGEGVYWSKGSAINFGSNEASTALAIKAFMLSGGDREMAAKAVRFITRNRRGDYWSNTYATAQVVGALVEYAKKDNELNPKFTYTVKLDGEEIQNGSVTRRDQLIPEIEVPVETIKPGGSELEISMNGVGQVYSTLLIDEFHTDPEAQAEDHGIGISREYVNEKGEEYTLGVGDVAIVQLTLEGPMAEEYYGVIEDELPAGLVPINLNLKNEQFNQDANQVNSAYGLADAEYTKNGAVLSLFEVVPGKRVYRYKARVVSEGVYRVPPAKASLMYAPEIYGRSEAQTLRVTTEAEIIPGKLLTSKKGNLIWWVLAGGITLMGLGLGGVIVLKKKGITFTQIKDRLRQKFGRKPAETTIAPPPAASVDSLLPPANPEPPPDTPTGEDQSGSEPL